MTTDFLSVTEIAGDDITQEQVDRLCNRYYWAGQYCQGKDGVESGCGSGPGLGYLNSIANSFEAGDYSGKMVELAKTHYGDRMHVQQFNAQLMPFEGKSKDVIILFEAIYYLPDAETFLSECKRILRPGGKVLIATANKDLYDFNPSPHSHRYYGVVELKELFSKFGFHTEFFGDTPVDGVCFLQRILRPIKKLVVMSGLMPRSMVGKKLLKRIVFGNLVKMPAEIDSDTSEHIEPEKISSSQADKRHKVIYCAATVV